jgi:hypothetical protein
VSFFLSFPLDWLPFLFCWPPFFFSVGSDFIQQVRHHLWRYTRSFLLRSPRHVLVCDSSPTTSYTIVTILGDYRRGLDWWMELLTTYLCTRLGTTSNYSAIVIFHNSQITTAPVKLFPACCVFTSRSLATTSSGGDSSASRAQDLTSETPVQNWNDFVAPVVFLITPRHGPSRNPRFQKYLFHCASILCCGNVVTEPLPRNGSGIFAYLAVVA